MTGDFAMILLGLVRMAGATCNLVFLLGRSGDVFDIFLILLYHDERRARERVGVGVGVALHLAFRFATRERQTTKS